MKLKHLFLALIVSASVFLSYRYYEQYTQHGRLSAPVADNHPVWPFETDSADEQLDSDKKNKVLLSAISQSLNQNHFKALAIDDKFSEDLFKLYIDRLDFSKRFLLASDITELEAYKTKLDDEINEGSFEFFDRSSEIIEQRVADTDTFYHEILSVPFDFDTDEEYMFDTEKMPYATDLVQLKEYWRLYLKYQTMTRLAEMMDRQEKAQEDKDTSVQIKTFAELESDARDKVRKSHDDWYRRLAKTNIDDRRSIYFNSITNIYDPHSEYYPPKDKENFDIAMTGQFEGIGATLQQSDEYIKVTQIIPGSASWKQGQLKDGDVILKVAQANAEPVDIVDMRLDDAVQLIRGEKGTEVRLTVRKIDGSTIVIPIVRDKVVLEETYAKSAIISDKDQKTNMGYIYLPKFYADFSDRNGRQCSKDVKAELEKLKKENIDGIVIDLRNNGGGSLQDVIEMVGYFIDKGPVVQVKDRYSAPSVYSDTDKGIIYSGNLIVLINNFSASASEIFAAAIQDYKRGVLVGTPSFGKGTVQRFLDFDSYLSKDYDDVKPLGSIKMTIQKFYRINGTTNQLKGVLPDVALPDNYKYLEIGEKESDHPIDSDEISSTQFTVWNNGSLDVNKLAKKSAQRVAKDSLFTLVEENAQRMKTQQDESIVSLNLVKFRQQEKQRKDDLKRFDALNNINNGLKVTALKDDLSNIQSDTVQVARFEQWQKQLQKDMYLPEALYILKDMK